MFGGRRERSGTYNGHFPLYYIVKAAPRERIFTIKAMKHLVSVNEAGGAGGILVIQVSSVPVLYNRRREWIIMLVCRYATGFHCWWEKAGQENMKTRRKTQFEFFSSSSDINRENKGLEERLSLSLHIQCVYVTLPLFFDDSWWIRFWWLVIQ